MSDLHDRIAKALGWSTKDAQSLSMASLRELVRPVDPKLAREMDYVIQSGAYLRGEPAPKSRRHHATVKGEATRKHTISSKSDKEYRCSCGQTFRSERDAERHDEWARDRGDAVEWRQ